MEENGIAWAGKPSKSQELRIVEASGTISTGPRPRLKSIILTLHTAALQQPIVWMAQTLQIINRVGSVLQIETLSSGPNRTEAGPSTTVHRTYLFLTSQN